MRFWRWAAGMAAVLAVMTARAATAADDFARFKDASGQLRQPDIPLFVPEGGQMIMNAGNYRIASYFRQVKVQTFNIDGARVQLQGVQYGDFACRVGGGVTGLFAYVFVNAPPTSQLDRAKLYRQYLTVAERLLDSACPNWRAVPRNADYFVNLKFFYEDLYLDQDWNLHAGPPGRDVYYPQFAEADYSWRAQRFTARGIKEGYEAFTPVIHGFRGLNADTRQPYADIPNFNFLQALSLLKTAVVTPKESVAIAQNNQALMDAARKRRLEQMSAGFLPGLAITIDRAQCQNAERENRIWRCDR